MRWPRFVYASFVPDIYILHPVLGNSKGKIVFCGFFITLEENGTLAFSNAAPSLTPVLAEKLFDRYFTVESGGQGTGIGLSIARHLMEQMDGSVSRRMT